MKVFKKLVLITALILVTCINVSFANQTGEVNTSGIRIRKEANTTSDILTVIYKGDKVEILDDKENVKMLLNVINVKYNEKLDNDLFDVNKYQKKETK